jgi:putative inorganic carbon (hco3(-)) transporter
MLTNSIEKSCQIVTETALLMSFIVVPLIVIPVTSEVFEFNKITVVYILSIIILFSELVRLSSQRQPILKLPSFSLTGTIFLLSLLVATITSTDVHVSLFGYYARFQGGFLSWLAYAIILIALFQQNPSFIRTAVKASIFSGLLVSAWGFLEHWGIDASYWVQDVRYRVFSTLGQPNWLAAYLAMLLPFLFSFYIEAKNRKIVTVLLATIVLFYTCFIFTYSRGGNLGLAAAIITWITLIGLKKVLANKLRLITLALTITTITGLFASSLTPLIFRAAPHRTVENLETGDQTAQTRLIVWQGALDIFRHHPITGTGLETFGESFYQYRPVSMNEISDFDFLFNKAHNEYLNYLATTGILGTLAYIALITNFFFLAFKKIKNHRSFLVVAAASSMAGYLVQNFFGFTVVPLALLFLLNLAVVGIESVKTISWKWNSSLTLGFLAPIIAVPLATAMIILIVDLWRADLAYNQGLNSGNSIQSISDFSLASHLNPTEPLYYIELAFSYAQAASYLPNTPTARQDATFAEQYSNLATSISPNERTIWRIRAQALSMLIMVDAKYKSQALMSFQKTVALAPTDPRVRSELANYYLSEGEQGAAISTLKDTLRLKPDFVDATIALARIYLDQGKAELSKKYADLAKKADPNNPAIKSLNQEPR